MNKVGAIQATMTGAYILMLLGHLSKEDYNKASVVRLTQRLRKILKHRPISDARLADEAYDVIKKKYKDEPIELVVGILIETLAFNKEEYMKQLFGNDIITFVERASAKITIPGLNEKQRKDSYRVADELKDSLEKTVFDNKDK
jgi:hypothetical protein